MLIDLNQFAEKFRAKIQSDLTTLELIAKWKENPELLSPKTTVSLEDFHFSFDTPPINFLELRENVKCFKSVIGALQDYMDELIAVVKLLRSTPIGVLKIEETNQYLQRNFKPFLMGVATNQKLKTEDKLKLLLTKSDPKQKIVFDSLKSLFYIRNGFEHHKGIAKAERTLTYKQIAVRSTSGKVFEGFSGRTEPGEGLVLTTIDVAINFDEGNSIILNKEHLFYIIMNLMMFSIQELKEAARSQITNVNM